MFCELDESTIPDAPCMEYLPTFTPKIAHTWSIWEFGSFEILEIVSYGQNMPRAIMAATWDEKR